MEITRCARVLIIVTMADCRSPSDAGSRCSMLLPEPAMRLQVASGDPPALKIGEDNLYFRALHQSHKRPWPPSGQFAYFLCRIIFLWQITQAQTHTGRGHVSGAPGPTSLCRPTLCLGHSYRHLNASVCCHRALWASSAEIFDILCIN